MPNSEIINLVKGYTDTLKKSGISLDAVYIFGSQVKGTMHEWSDIDVAIVSPYLSDKYTEGRFLLWKLRRDTDLQIEPHGFSPEGWKDESNPMAYEIRKTGVKVL